MWTLLLVWAVHPRTTRALPRYAIFEGVRCSACHVDPTGAGMRNDTGGTEFMQELSLAATQSLVTKNVSGRLTNWVAVGTDIRAQHQTVVQTPRTNQFTLPQASLYLALQPIKHVTGYVDYDLANTTNRVGVAMLHELPLGLYVKAGRFFLPYGLRIDDDTSFIRTATNMTFASPDVGAELGVAPGPFEFAAAVSNGVPGGFGDENRAKAVTATAHWVAAHGRLGASIHWNRRPAVELVQSAVHGGARLGPVAWLAELDWQRSRTTASGATTQLLAGFSEVNWRILQGLYAKAQYDFLDPDLHADNDRQHRIGIGLDVAPLPYLQCALWYRLNIGGGAASADQLLAKVHVFF